MKSRECKDQRGGGNCSLCGSPDTNKSTCPLNPDAKNPNSDKHPLAATKAPAPARAATAAPARAATAAPQRRTTVQPYAAAAHDESEENNSDSFAASAASQRRTTDQLFATSAAAPAASSYSYPSFATSAALSGKAAASFAPPSTTNSISILISGHGSEESGDMFFENTAFNTLKPEFANISDIINNVHMISVTGRWGAYGLVIRDLNEREMTISQDFFVTNASSTPYEIMQGLSQTLPAVLQEHIEGITYTSVTNRATIIQYVKKYGGGSYFKIIKILESLLQIKTKFSKYALSRSQSNYIWTWVIMVGTQPEGAYTPEYMLSQLLDEFEISQDAFIKAWRSEVDLGFHQLAISAALGTTYSLIRPCINKKYSFKRIDQEVHSGIHVLDVRLDGIPVFDLKKDILTDSYNLLFDNENSFHDKFFDEIREKLQGELLSGTGGVQNIQLYTIIAAFRELGFNEINIIDNSCRVDIGQSFYKAHGDDTLARVRSEVPFRKQLTECESRVPRVSTSSSSSSSSSSGINSKCAGKKGILSGCTISGGNLKLHDDCAACAAYAADIIIKYLDKTYQNGTDKLQKQSLQFIVSLFGKDIIQYLDNRKNTLSTLRDIIINKYFNADQHWREKAYLICKDY